MPDNPGAWLMRTARNAALDRLRRDKVFQEKLQQIGFDLEAQEALIVPDFVDGLDAARRDVTGDDLLRLVFDAAAEFERAVGMATNARERALLLERAGANRACAGRAGA